MFSSLFDVKNEIEPTINPSFQQLLTRFETAHWEQAEQVPAYATVSHATWFNNPANKLVRGVSMGVSRSAAELQRVGQAGAPMLDAKTSDSRLNSRSIDNHGQSDNIVDIGTVACLDIAERPHIELASKHIYVPLPGKVADLEDILIDPLLEGAIFHNNKGTKDSLYHREPVADIDCDFSGDDEDSSCA
jgi:hypothetical protein